MFIHHWFLEEKEMFKDGGYVNHVFDVMFFVIYSGFFLRKHLLSKF